MRAGEADDRTGYERGRREGGVDRELAEIADHFRTLNGDVATMAERIQALTNAVTSQGRDITDLVTSVDSVVPQVRQLVAEGIGTKQVAEALSDRKVTDESGGDRNRARVAWAVGIVASLAGVIGATVLVVRAFTG